MPRCPNGSRKNKKGICVPTTEKKIKKRKKKKNIKLIAPKKKWKNRIVLNCLN